MDLGATPLEAYRKVILPEIMPGVVTGMLLAFTLSLDDFVISFFTTGSGRLHPLDHRLFHGPRGINPKINAISTILFLTVLLLLMIVNIRMSGNHSKRRDENAEAKILVTSPSY